MKLMILFAVMLATANLHAQTEIGIGGDGTPAAWFTIYHFRPSLEDSSDVGLHSGLLFGAGPFATGDIPGNVTPYDGDPLPFWTVGRTTHTANIYIEAPVMLDIAGFMFGGSAGVEFDAERTWWYSDVSNMWWHNDAVDDHTVARFSYGARAGYRFGKLGLIGEWNNFRHIGGELFYTF